MAKIKTYDYNREENTLTVTYESGVVRKYSADRLPKTLQALVPETAPTETIPTELPESSDNEPATEETVSTETLPAEEPEPVYTLPYPLEVPFDMRINRLCSKCRYLYSCFRENRARVLEDIHYFEPCDDICGECTLCCSNFKPTIQTVPKVSAFSADDDTGDDLPF